MGTSSTGAHENGNRNGATSHTWDLPPEDKIMWEGLTLHNGGQTLYGNVWPKVGLLHQTAVGHFSGISVNARVVPLCIIANELSATGQGLQ